ncbi:MAG: hypothetical protein H6734_20625, partial [Alphaproteobacteria bacterium]|nr:hypothetical protein [Alphaproteobacteria bacterium]
VALEGARERAKALSEGLKETRARLATARDWLARTEEGLRAGEARRDGLHADVAALLEQRDALGPLRRALEQVQRSGLVERIDAATGRLDQATRAREAARSRLATAEADLDARSSAALDPRALAGLLAASLDGACPVCGSEDHPHPAAHVDVASVLAGVDARAQAVAEVDVARRALDDAERDIKGATAVLAGLQAEVPAVAGTSDPTVLRAMLDRLRRASTTLERGVERAEHQARALQGPLDEARGLVSTASAAVSALARQEARDEAEMHASLTLEGRAWGEMTAALGDHTLFDLPRMLVEIQRKDREREALEPALTEVERRLERLQAQWERRRDVARRNRSDLDAVEREHEGLETRREELVERVQRGSPDGDARTALAEVEASLAAREAALAAAQTAVEDTTRDVLAATALQASAAARAESEAERLAAREEELATALSRAGLAEVPDPQEALQDEDLDAAERELESWFQERGAVALSVRTLEEVDLPPVDADRLAELTASLDAARTALREAEDARIRTAETARRLSQRAARHAELVEDRTALSTRASRLEELARLLRGDRFVEYVANDYLADLTADATRHLQALTRGRYALDLDDQGTFLVADLDAGGATRPASSLSGGETFLASLALALALSTQVQRHNASALELFFLDEGFGSLDPESLDRVMTAIEGLAAESRVIGLISHVGAVRERVPRRLELHCPRDGSGTVVRYRES